MEYLKGVVERITYSNEESGFTVMKLKTPGMYDLTTVVGSMPSVCVGSTIALKGEWKVDGKYGKQFSSLSYEETIPATLAGIEKYLGSGLIKGIGPVFARKIVRTFHEDTIRIIEEEPDRLLETEGIGRKRVVMIKKAWQDQKEVKNVMLFLQSHDVSPSFAAKIYKNYGNDSIDIVKENPFRLADDIWGIGFKTADQIAEKMGFDKHAYVRCRSGVLYVLNELAGEGHCFATRDQLTKATVKILELEVDAIHTAIDSMIEEKKLILDFETCIYLPHFYFSEKGVAKRIIEINNSPSMFLSDQTQPMLEELQKQCGIVYDEIQKQAIMTALCSKFMVLTGGPGTGKTTTTLGIINAFKKSGAKICLAAPTGRAAKRMTEMTGMEAKTIHRLLEYRPPQGYMRVVDNNPVDCDVLIVDEVSMVDILLMYNLLRAVRNDCIMILVGDIDQLPSVNAGNVLKDIIASNAVQVIKLTRIFRQAQGSMIITNAHRINRGDFPLLEGAKNRDFFFIQQEEPEKIAQEIVNLCVNRLPAFYQVDPIQDIQVLCPMQRGETGAYQLNRALQQALNPVGLSIQYGSMVYRVRDKVMQIRNNYDKNVFNGDIGSIVRIDEEDRTLAIRFDDQEIEYDSTELDEVVLAYACTIHKSQGSEYKIVVAPFSTQHYMMLQRNLLYTCITRAKKIMVLVGTKKALAMAVRNDRITKRNTMLATILSSYKQSD